MCFYNDDYEWSASVCETSEADSGPATKCAECGCKIEPHEWRKHIFMQEHEDCQICQDPFSDDYIDRKAMEAELNDGDADWAAAQLKALDDHTHDYGETYDYDCCRDCDKILQAVEDRETAEGCPVDERRPALGEMQESLMEHEQWAEYAAHAVAMFPELAGNEFIRKLQAVEG